MAVPIGTAGIAGPPSGNSTSSALTVAGGAGNVTRPRWTFESVSEMSKREELGRPCESSTGWYSFFASVSTSLMPPPVNDCVATSAAVLVVPLEVIAATADRRRLANDAVVEGHEWAGAAQIVDRYPDRIGCGPATSSTVRIPWRVEVVVCAATVEVCEPDVCVLACDCSWLEPPQLARAAVAAGRVALASGARYRVTAASVRPFPSHSWIVSEPNGLLGKYEGIRAAPGAPPGSLLGCS